MTCRQFFQTVICLSLFLATPAIAHKVTVFAWVEGDRVFTESKMSGGKRVAAGEITVYDGENNLLLKGNTDDQGEFSFKIPQKPPLVVELNAGMGHQARWTIRPDDVDDGIFPDENKPEEKQDMEASSPPLARPAQPAVNLDSGELEAVVEKALEKKLRPVIRMLADSQQKDPSLSEIIGGIGYIMGIVGLIAYFKGRSSDRNRQ